MRRARTVPMRHRVLFVTWDGPDQAYLESLFLPIFSRLREHGFDVDVLQYSTASRDARDASERACRAHEIGYTGRRAARALGPLGVAATIAAGAHELRRRASQYSVVMARSIPPAAMALATASVRAKLLFDADGLSADERVETVGWRWAGPLYATYREIERAALSTAGSVITRTDASRDILVARAGPVLPPERVHVIPNGSDERRFSPADAPERSAVRWEMGVPDGAPWFVSVGSIGPQYLPELQLELFRRIAALRADARFSVLTGRPEMIVETWRAVLGNRLDVRRVAPDQVSRLLGAADVGIALRAPSFSQRAVSPIKIAEYLLSGIPVVATRGVGDLDALLGRHPDAALLIQADRSELDRAAEWAIEAATARRVVCGAAARRLGVSRYSLAACAASYAAALRAMPDCSS